MKRIKIDYGIDLGTTNSAIARMEYGEAIVKKSLDLQKDTIPSCVMFTKKGAVEIGDRAISQLGVDRRQEFQNPAYSSNVFIEFKRTMGTDKSYSSSHMKRTYNSEELSSEVLKKLKEPISDESISALVVTVPAKFGANQKEATRKAAELAGFKQIELLSEPVAASYAYGLNSKIKNGFWVVFDFGGGTFDAALIKLEEGVFKVISTEGDNYLGGKNLDFAIIDEILLPYFKDNYNIEAIVSDDEKLVKFRSQFKDKAEQLKIALSSKQQEELFSQLGENFGEDDDGTPFEFDLTITREELNRVQQPFFQRAVDITKDLLKNNNLNGNQIDALILVGGPTLTPIMRQMLKDQITENIDFSVDPMTVVAKGAALYASTLNITVDDEPVAEDAKIVSLEINYEASTVETDSLINIKIKSEAALAGKKAFAVVSRKDGGWSSSKSELKQKPTLFELSLKEGINHFEVKLTDETGNHLVCTPNEFTIRCILEGATGVGQGATLPFHWGIEIKNRKTDRMEFVPLKGLEKDRELTSKGLVGVYNGLKTVSAIRPGVKDDFLRIPIYQGTSNAKGSRAIYNEHVFDLEISGEDLPALLPAGSTFDLTVHLDRNESVSGKVYFHKLDFQYDFNIDKDHRIAILPAYKIESELNDGMSIIEDIAESNVDFDMVELENLKKSLFELQEYFEKGRNDSDRRKEVFDKLREIMIKVDNLDKGTIWDRLEKDILEKLQKLEVANNEMGTAETKRVFELVKGKSDQVLRSKDQDLAREYLEQLEQLYMAVTLIYQLVGRFRYLDRNFSSVNWTDTNKARHLINEGLEIIMTKPNEDVLLSLIIEVENLMPDLKCNGCRRTQSQCVCVTN